MDITNIDNLNIDLSIPDTESAPVSVIEPNITTQEPYQPSVTDIQFLQKQVTITTEQATQLLLKNNGNYVNAIVDFTLTCSMLAALPDPKYCRTITLIVNGLTAVFAQILKVQPVFSKFFTP